MAQLASTVVYGNLTSTGSIYMGSDLVATQNWVSGQRYTDGEARDAVEAGNLTQIDGVNNFRIRFNSNTSWMEFTDQSNNRAEIVTKDTYIDDATTWTGDHINCSSIHEPNTDTNYYLTAANFDTGNGVLSLTVNGTSNVSEDLDGRYAITNSNASFNTINLANHEQGDYTSDGDLYHDASAGFYGYSSNAGGTALLWDNNNVSEGSFIKIESLPEGCPRINVDCVSTAVVGDYIVRRDGGGDMCGAIVCATNCFRSTCTYLAGSGGYHLKIPSACGCAVDFVATSDCRFKKNIEPVIDALSKVDKLCGICYDLCMDNSHEIGLIAQDVEKVEPRLVTKSEPDEEHREKYGINDISYGLKYDKFSGLFVEAIKELKKKDIEQQRQIIILQDQINKLEEKINNK